MILKQAVEQLKTVLSINNPLSIITLIGPVENVSYSFCIYHILYSTTGLRSLRQLFYIGCGDR